MTSKSTREQATDTEIQMLIDSHEKGTAMFMRTDAYYFMAKELQERRKADSEPVVWIVHARTGEQLTTDSGYVANAEGILGLHSTPLYRHAQQPVKNNEFIPQNLDKALGVVGVALPESKEEFNFQIERWIQRLIDRVIRYADEFQALPSQVVPEGLRLALSNAGIAAPESDEMLAATHDKYVQALVSWVRDRKPFQPAPLAPEILPCAVELKPGLILDKGCKTTTLLTALRSRADHDTEIDAMTPEERAEHDANIEAFKAMLPKPAPVVTDDGREQFEEWFKFHHGDEHSIEKLHRANGGANYGDPHVDLAWIAWKDSRTAMLAAVPPAPKQENI